MMHRTILISAAALLFSTATAIPYKRDVETETVTEIATVVEQVTATVWVDPTDAPDPHAQFHSPLVLETSDGGVGYHRHTHVTSSSSSTQAPPPPPPAPTTTSTTQAAPTTSQAPPPAPPTTTSVYVAPVPTTPVYVAPTTTTPAYVAPAPATTSVYVAPVQPTTQAPAPTTTAQAVQAASSNGGSSSGGTTYSGDITYYDVGLGSCGITNTDSDMVVAMAAGLMNKATMCGKTITLSYGGSTQQATVVDTCPGCSSGSLDLSPALFKAIALNGDGRVHDVKWWFN